jgi:hypothetical protein
MSAGRQEKNRHSVFAGWRFRDLSYTNTSTTAQRASAVGLIGGGNTPRS